MIKCIRKALCLALCLAILASVMIPSVFAAELPPSGDTISPNYMIDPITGDQYADRIYPTIGAAKQAYGSNWVYQQTYHVYNGTVYNWYYLFSDGTKNYFRVAYNDDPILSQPEEVIIA